MGKLRIRTSTTGTARLCDVSGILFSPDGSMFASMGTPGGVHFWRMNKEGDGIEKWKSIGNSVDGVFRMCYSHDGKLLATVDDQGRVKLWSVDDVSSEPSPLNLHSGDTLSLTFRKTNDEVLTSGYEGQVIIWDVKKSKVERVWHYPGPILNAKFDPTGTKVITNNSNGSIYVCDRAKPE